MPRTIFVPSASGVHPAVVFVHGSGPETREASNFLADRLTREGFASLTFDKRGAGASTGDWRESNFADLANDVRACIQVLKARPDMDRRRIGLIHGADFRSCCSSLEGGLVGHRISPAGARRGRIVDFDPQPILERLRAQGKDITTRTFRGADHALFIAPESGQSFRWPRVFPGYIETLTDWIKVTAQRSR
ncbi:MAG: hypothetical protein EXQ48_05225 [Acidobacteria bacterium]|nr:hypothetical protein [Acidobacteriota bacterium]